MSALLLANAICMRPASNPMQWKRKAEQYLMKSGLKYTIIHPGGGWVRSCVCWRTRQLLSSCTRTASLSAARWKDDSCVSEAVSCTQEI